MRNVLRLSPCLALLVAAGCSSTPLSSDAGAPHDGGPGGGTGGVTGALGGHTGGGGAVGTGGAGGAGDACTTLPQDYAAAFVNARSCNPNLGSAECAQTASGSLQCPGCMTHVNDTTVLDQLRTAWAAASCPPTPCPAFSCVRLGTGACVANDASTGDGASGTCVEMF